jgi:hypothetical protein
MMLRKPLIILAIALLLVLGTLTLLIPFLHEAFFLFAYLMAMEFETGRLGQGRAPALAVPVPADRAGSWQPLGATRPGGVRRLTNPAK